VGVPMSVVEKDLVDKPRIAALRQGLQDLRWNRAAAELRPAAEKLTSKTSASFVRD
jgi:hypothetical protein